MKHLTFDELATQYCERQQQTPHGLRLTLEALAGSPTYASADAAKLAVERQLLELARVVVGILG